MATKRARKRPKTCEAISPRTGKRCRAVPRKEADPDRKYRCVGHSTSDDSKARRAVAATAGRSATGVPSPGKAAALSKADFSSVDGCIDALNAAARELAAKNLSPQEADALHKLAKTALDWHGKTAATPKGADKAEHTVEYVEDGAEEAPAPPDFDETVEVGVEPPAVGVQ